MISRLRLAILLFAMAADSWAASGFIRSGTVDRGSVYAEIRLELRCAVQYLDYDPVTRSDIVRIHFRATNVCVGAAPSVANSRQLFRPPAADDAWLESVEYSGEEIGNQYLRLNFTDEVRFDVRQVNNDVFSIRVLLTAETAAPKPERRSATRRKVQTSASIARYVINLESSQRAPAESELPRNLAANGARVFVSEAIIGGVTWYRTRLGHFDSADQASRALYKLRESYPRAWIDRATTSVEQQSEVVEVVSTTGADQPDAGTVAGIMDDARRAMIGGELSRAVQLYTKVVRMPANEYQPQAQEFLALARERNGQLAHAKAEYGRYLEQYPETDGADRVRQRLAALMTTAPSTKPSTTRKIDAEPATGRSDSDTWKIRTFVSQHYRRDVNQVNDLERVVSQSSLYTDANVDVRRRGDRFDVLGRFSGGHRYDVGSDSNNTGEDVRISYAYADLADSVTGLRGRLGRQTRNTGGVLGRFDGVNLSYALTERLNFETVVGKPVYSTSEGVEDERSFYGVSSTFGLFHKNLDFGFFYLKQEIENLTDRETVGAEVRYFGDRNSLWGVVDYDLEFGELGSAFLQGSWNLPADIRVTGLYDQRRSPFLNLGNALIGQQLETFAELQVLYTEDELRQLALDRAPKSTTVTLGLSKPLTPKLQVNLNASLSTIDATPESGGVLAMESAEYNYYSADVVASSVFTENDVGIVGLRFAESDTTDVYSVNLDTRFPINRAWRISPRLRVDYREIKSDDSIQWIYTPGVRVYYRHGRQLRVEFEAGAQLSDREMAIADQERRSWFVNAGYQWNF